MDAVPERLAGTGTSCFILEIIRYAKSLAAPPATSPSSAPVSGTVGAASKLPVMIGRISESVSGDRNLALPSSMNTMWIGDEEVLIPPFDSDASVPTDSATAAPPPGSREPTGYLVAACHFFCRFTDGNRLSRPWMLIRMY